MHSRRNNRKYLEGIRKKLRKGATPEEEKLWSFLQQRRLAGRKFRRQHSVDNYVLDFYCPELRLAIELDGAHHYTLEGLAKDAFRDKYLLEEMKIVTIRFENQRVRTATNEVLAEIKSKIEELSTNQE